MNMDEAHRSRLVAVGAAWAAAGDVEAPGADEGDDLPG